jgi:hypothetical protein
MIRSQFGTVMELADRHDLKALHEMFWQLPSALLVAKSAIPSEGNWAGFWGNEAIDQKLHDITAAGPVVLQPGFSRLKAVGLTHDLAESYAPMNITVSYAGHHGTPRPFLMIIDWIKVGKHWKVASEIILPVRPPAAVKDKQSRCSMRPCPGTFVWAPDMFRRPHTPSVLPLRLLAASWPILISVDA